jgi:hypothetical protein
MYLVYDKDIDTLQEQHLFKNNKMNNDMKIFNSYNDTSY